MKIAVITPYYQEPGDWLRRCLESVRAQTYPCTHFLISDGYPQSWLDSEGVRHVHLGRPHGDYGNTPRAIGGLLAISEGFDAICFLDADNAYEPDHIEACVRTAEESSADFVISGRKLVREDGSAMAIAAADERNGSHVDTNCYFLLFGAFHTIARWATAPKAMASLFDRFYLKSLREERLKSAHTGRETVRYLCTWASFYRALGEEPPVFAKENISAAPFLEWLKRLRPQDYSHIYRMSGVNFRPPAIVHD